MSDLAQRLPMQGGLMPRRAGGGPQRAVEWVRKNLFSSVFNGILTLAVLALAALILPPLFRWGITHATFGGTDRKACTGDGAS